MPLLEVQHLQKVYTSRFGGRQVEALQNVNFSMELLTYLKKLYTILGRLILVKINIRIQIFLPLKWCQNIIIAYRFVFLALIHKSTDNSATGIISNSNPYCRNYILDFGIYANTQVLHFFQFFLIVCQLTH